MRNKFALLAGVTVVVVALAIWASTSRTPQAERPITGPLLPTLTEGLNEVRRVRLVGAGEKTIATFEQRDGRWTVAERHGYDADAARLRELLMGLSNAKLVEAKTKDPKRHAELGVEDVKAADAKSVRVEIEGLKDPIRLIVGEQNPRGDGTFVRREGEPQSWLVRGRIAVDREAGNWLARDLVDLPSSRIAEVEIRRAGERIRATKAKPEDPNYTLQDLPRGRKAASDYVANGFASVLSGLRIDDAVPDAQAELPVEAERRSVTWRFFDGLVVNATLWTREGKHYARLEASVDEARANAHIDAEQAKEKTAHEAAVAAAAAKPAAGEGDSGKAADTANEELAPQPPASVVDPAKDRAARLAALNSEAQALTKKFSGWTFVIPPYKYGNVDKPLEDLLEPRAGAAK